MRFSDFNWFDVESYLENDDRVMLVLGACEQHAYLSLLTDAKIPLALADAVSQQSGVLVAPSLNFGASPYFLAYPGTISLRIATLMDVVEDLVRSLYGHGFRRIVVLNGHGGNDPVRGRLYEVANALPELQISWYAWWQSHSVQTVAENNNLKPAHANWLEAFPFTMVSELPPGEKVPPHVPGILSAKGTRRTYGDGVFGGAYQASPEVMDKIFSAAVEDILQLLKFE
ncbi:MAG TPA: creatininase [Chloroflexi bacterium]|nr:creatininase [Chloroflexota bacterium]